MSKLNKTLQAAERLSLGISIGIAIAIGVGLGVWMKNTFNQPWLLWLGIFWGFLAAVLNVKKEFTKLKKELDALGDEKNSRLKKKND